MNELYEGILGFI